MDLLRSFYKPKSVHYFDVPTTKVTRNARRDSLNLEYFRKPGYWPIRSIERVGTA